MRLDVLTLFPGIFNGFLTESIPKIAQEKNAARIHLHNIRDWSGNKHNKVDDRPFGGGPGMVMACQPIVDAVEAVRAMGGERAVEDGGGTEGRTAPEGRADGHAPGRLFFLTPEGRKFDQKFAEELANEPRITLVCGRYEGFDERIFDILQPERISLGDFVLSGGEVAAMAVMDAILRLLPDVLGSADSAVEDSFTQPLLDHPHYTQPVEYRGLAVPEVLRGGNHALISKWRHDRAVEKTRRFRPDLLLGE